MTTIPVEHLAAIGGSLLVLSIAVAVGVRTIVDNRAEIVSALRGERRP